MKETAQQYIQRINGYTEGKQPLVVQAATAKKLERLIKGIHGQIAQASGA